MVAKDKRPPEPTNEQYANPYRIASCGKALKKAKPAAWCIIKHKTYKLS